MKITITTLSSQSASYIVNVSTDTIGENHLSVKDALQHIEKLLLADAAGAANEKRLTAEEAAVKICERHGKSLSLWVY